MAYDSEQKIKLLVLYDILCKLTDETHAMHTDEIIAELAKRNIPLSRKVLPRDIAMLNQYGYEVESYKKKYHYYYVATRTFDTAEIVTLADAVKASKLSGTQKKNLIEKLCGTLGTHRAALLSRHLLSLDTRTQAGASLIYNVDAIDRAISENKQITFRYFDYDEKHKKVYRKDGKVYMVSPIVMVWNKDNYYLLCFRNNRDDMVTYRIDMMDTVTVSPSDRQPHEEYETFRTEEYRAQVFSMFGGELQIVTLSVVQEMVSDLFDKFGDTVTIKKKANDVYHATVKVQISPPFFTWVVGSQGKVHILAPTDVTNAFRSFVEKIKSAY